MIHWIIFRALRPPKSGFPQFRRLDRRKSASCGHCLSRLISQPMIFPPQAVIGCSSPFRERQKEEDSFLNPFSFVYFQFDSSMTLFPRFLIDARRSCGALQKKQYICRKQGCK
jgi:hypothetical protein